jgi:ankyrin repeat protein
LCQQDGTSRHSSADVVKLLLQAGAAVNETTAALGSPLSAAAAMRQADTAALLLQYGAEVDAVDSRGYSALVRAAASQNVSAVQMLLQAGAPVNARCAIGASALHAAVMAHAQFSPPTSSATMPAVQALLRAGADASAAMHSGLTPLHVCARDWPASISQLLLDAGAKLEACVRTVEGEPAAVKKTVDSCSCLETQASCLC